MPSFYDLMKYAKTGIASPGMTAYDKMRAVAMAGGKVKTLTGVPPLSFKSNGKPLISWSMIGNGQQNGTPSPDNIIMPEFCGKLVGTDWIIPITNAGQTTPIYLGQTQTLRRIKKLVLTGQEDGWNATATSGRFVLAIDDVGYGHDGLITTICSHYSSVANQNLQEMPRPAICANANYPYVNFSMTNGLQLESFKQYLNQQYASGTPVTVWYVLDEPATAIVNEPLCKIGDYSDTLDSADAGITIPTARGQNTLTVDTELQPSSMTITYR